MSMLQTPWSTRGEATMGFKRIGGGFVVELSSTYAFVKFWQWEVFVSFEGDGGAAGRWIILSRT